MTVNVNGTGSTGRTGDSVTGTITGSFARTGIPADSGEAVIQGFRSALVVSAIAATPAILLSALGGQRGVRVAAGRAAEKAAEGVQVVREALETEISAMVPLFRGQKSAMHRNNGRNGAATRQSIETAEARKEWS